MTLRETGRDVLGYLSVTVFVLVVMVGTYSVKDWMDSNERAALRDQITAANKDRDEARHKAEARADKAIIDAKSDFGNQLLAAQHEFSDRAKERDESIDDLRKQNRLLATLVRQSKESSDKAVVTSQVAANAATRAASAADSAAATSKTTQQDLKSATLPTALPPVTKPWHGGNGH